MESAERTVHRREFCRENCPLDSTGHCQSHIGMVAMSKWLVGIVIALLLAVLGAVAITRDAVGQLAPQVATAAITSERNLAAIVDLGRQLRQLERDSIMEKHGK